MDEASRVAVAFLDGALAAREALRLVLNHYHKLGLATWNYPGYGPIWALDRYLDLGITVGGADKQAYELSARLRWSDEEWLVQGDIDLVTEDEHGNCSNTTLRELPEWRGTDWQLALDHWRAAIAGFVSFDDLIPSGAERA